MSWNSVIDKLGERLLWLLPNQNHVDWSTVIAARWQENWMVGQFAAQGQIDSVQLDDLLNIDDQKQKLLTNTQQLLAGLPANNALLWGARGTGKSSLIHALLNEYHGDGLRLVEMGTDDLAQLPTVITKLADEPYKFLLFCDDLSFESDDPSYKALKSALEGSVFKTAKNVLIYATSNRRHLVPEYHSDNQQSQIVDGELHHGEAVEEKISLSDRFGLWLSFYPFKQAAYLDVVAHWVNKHAIEVGQSIDLEDPQLRAEALQWALARGARNGRTAQYFARYWVGSRSLTNQN